MIDTVKAWAKSVDKNDAQFLLSTLFGIALWWFFVGRKRYGTRGMR